MTIDLRQSSQPPLGKGGIKVDAWIRLIAEWAGGFNVVRVCFGCLANSPWLDSLVRIRQRTLVQNL
jgi:hypothetical protein